MTHLAMPQLGESVTEGTIIKWLKQPGEPIEEDEPLVEIETEKVNVEVPSPWAGVLTEILVPEGETVAVGTDLADIETTEVASPPGPLSSGTGEGVTDRSGVGPEPQSVSPAQSTTPDPRPPTDPASSDATNGARQRYSPAVLRLAQEHQVDLAGVRGSGLGGRVTRKDVQNWLDQQGNRSAPAAAAAEQPALQALQESAATPAQAGRAPLVQEAIVAPPAVTVAARPRPETPQPEPSAAAAADEEIEHSSATRRAIAQHMLRSVQTSPHAWMVVEVDVSGLVALRATVRDEFQRREGVALSYLPFMLKATALALRAHPRLNSTWRDGDVVIKRRLNIGIAVDTDEGLMVPVIHDADSFSIAGLARQADDLATRARSRRLKLEDVQGGTFTVDNTGVFGSVVSAPIINQPQAGIVTMEAIIKRPVVVGDAIAVRSIMNCCLSFDHRILDGGDVGRFMAALKQHLQAYGPDTTLY